MAHLITALESLAATGFGIVDLGSFGLRVCLASQASGGPVNPLHLAARTSVTGLAIRSESLRFACRKPERALLVFFAFGHVFVTSKAASQILI
ncbi:MAG: hypothetical protein HYY84_14910 [Deltaproteobacteria bacterium]|nr:hypothetical protein [Deltaproteobacteria bacterium]